MCVCVCLCVRERRKKVYTVCSTHREACFSSGEKEGNDIVSSTGLPDLSLFLYPPISLYLPLSPSISPSIFPSLPLSPPSLPLSPLSPSISPSLPLSLVAVLIHSITPEGGVTVFDGGNRDVIKQQQSCSRVFTHTHTHTHTHINMHTHTATGGLCIYLCAVYNMTYD